MTYNFCFVVSRLLQLSFFFFFNDTATTEIYTLSLHDALPICGDCGESSEHTVLMSTNAFGSPDLDLDRKSTRLNSSHSQISYAVFCLKKKKTKIVCQHTSLTSILLFTYHKSIPRPVLTSISHA